MVRMGISVSATDRGLIPRPHCFEAPLARGASRSEAVRVLGRSLAVVSLLLLPFADGDRHPIFIHADPVHHSGGFTRDDEALDDSRSFLAHVVQIEALKVLRMEEVVGANHVA